MKSVIAVLLYGTAKAVQLDIMDQNLISNDGETTKENLGLELADISNEYRDYETTKEHLVKAKKHVHKKKMHKKKFKGKKLAEEEEEEVELAEEESAEIAAG